MRNSLCQLFSSFFVSLSLYTVKITEDPKELLIILVISIYIYCIRDKKQILIKLKIKIKLLLDNINNKLSKTKQNKKLVRIMVLFYIFANLFNVWLNRS